MSGTEYTHQRGQELSAVFWKHSVLSDLFLTQPWKETETESEAAIQSHRKS